jgi:hypothetical protein
LQLGGFVLLGFVLPNVPGIYSLVSGDPPKVVVFILLFLYSVWTIFSFFWPESAKKF